MDVGRVEVGTETLIDKSKSTKTVLMQLFGANTDIEGATIVNACYGGTAALLNAMTWCHFDTRYAIVVAADIAVYAPGPARPTGGAGAVALLIGRDAPLAEASANGGGLERATHASHTWDFYKPNPQEEYPVVDGQHSQMCYYRALEDVYQRFCDKMEQQQSLQPQEEGEEEEEVVFHAESPDYWIFHAPYNKLVQKSYARLFLVDAVRRRRRQQQQPPAQKHHENGDSSTMNGGSHDTASTLSTTTTYDHLLTEWLDVMPSSSLQDTYSDKNLEQVLKQISKSSFGTRLQDANAASQVVGNTYTASVFLGLASCIDRQYQTLTPGKTMAVFSYGSGALATLYRLHVYVCVCVL
jgi:hydroxymethylglutaryl-CoA synthase